MTHLDPEPAPDDIELATFDEPHDDAAPFPRGEPTDRLAHWRSTLGARQIVIGVGVGVAVTALIVASRRRGRAPTIAGTLVRSLVREIGTRVLLGAATAAGARLAEAVVPMVVAAISARRARRTRRPTRRARGAET